MASEHSKGPVHSRDRPDMSRRKFLHLAGGSTAFVLAGGAGAAWADSGAKQLVLPPPRDPIPTITTTKVVQTLEQAKMRHSRHRRQVLDGVVDAPEDSWADCERACTVRFRAHEY